MNLAEVIRGLLRRWYVTVPGILLAVAAAIGAWNVVPPAYERTATQLLLPGELSMPADSNPFLFLGGLANTADVLVRAVGSENVVNETLAEHPGVQIAVSRDSSTSGPVVLITVTASSDEEAGIVLDELVARTGVELAALQDGEAIPANNRITVLPITVDDASVLQQRTRLVATVGSGVLVLALTLVLAGLIDGMSRQRRRAAPADTAEVPVVGGGDDDASQDASATDEAPERWVDDEDPSQEAAVTDFADARPTLDATDAEAEAEAEAGTAEPTEPQKTVGVDSNGAADPSAGGAAARRGRSRASRARTSR